MSYAALHDRNYYTIHGKILLTFQKSMCALEKRKHNSNARFRKLSTMVTFSGECHAQERIVERQEAIK